MGLISYGDTKVIGDMELYEDLSLAKVGHHAAIKSGGGYLHFLPHNKFNGQTNIADTKIINAYSYAERTIFQADNTGTWTGTILGWTLDSSYHFLANCAYFQTDTIAATDEIRYCIWEGIDDTGILIFDGYYTASTFLASSEVRIVADGQIEFDAGVTYFHRLKSTSDFSLKMDVTNTTPWFASDVSFIREDHLFQTKPWVDGDTWNSGDNFIDSHKIYVCNTTGVQSGTFEDNPTLWDLPGQGLNSSDRIISDDGDYLKITDLSLIYNDGIRDRLIVNDLNLSMHSPNGDNYFRASNNYVRATVDGYIRLNINSSTAYLRSNDGTNMVRVKGASVSLRENNKDRVWVDNLVTELYSPSLSNYLKVYNSGLLFVHAGNNRINVDGNYTQLLSPDGGNLNIGNNGLFYSGAVVQTSAHKGVVNGIAELDASGIVPTSQLPAYVDAIVEYASLAALIAADPQEANKVYITVDDNKVYRYTGTAESYAEISPTLVLGTTNTTAYRGDRGLIAYDHSQSAHNYEPIDGNIVRSVAGVLPILDGSNLINISVSAGNQLISPNEIKDLTVSDTLLIYQDGTYARLLIDVAESSLRSPNGQEKVYVSDGAFTYHDGTRNRLEVNASGTMLVAPSGADSIIVDDTGAFYNGSEIITAGDVNISNWDTAYTHSQADHAPSDANNYSHPTGDGNKHVPANSTTNDGKVLTASDVAGTYTWETPGSGHDSDKIISPDALSNLTISNNSLIYTNNSGKKIFEADGTQTRIRGVGATPIYIKFGANSFEINDGVDRFMSNSSKAVMSSANDTWWSACYNDRYEVMDDVRARIVANSITTKLISPDGGDILSVANNEFTYNDGVADRILVNSVTARLVAQNGAYISAGTNSYINDGTRSRLKIDGTHTYSFSPAGTKWVDVSNSGVILQGNTGVVGTLGVTGITTMRGHLYFETANGKTTLQWKKDNGTRIGWIGYGSSGDEEFYIRNEVSGAHIEFQTVGGTVVFAGLPTSPAGLPTGGIYKSGGYVRIV